jgi:hypothetical protein
LEDRPGQHLEYQLVGYEVAALQVVGSNPTDLCAAAYFLAQQFAA